MDPLNNLLHSITKHINKDGDSNEETQTTEQLRSLITDETDPLLTFSCAKCDFVSNTRGHLTTHIKGVHEKVSRYKCSICEYKAFQMSNIKNHIGMKHNTDKVGDLIIPLFPKENPTTQSIINNKISKRKFYNQTLNQSSINCTKCSYNASSQKGLYHHDQNKHEKVRRHSCKLCDYEAYFFGAVKYHVIKSHNPATGEKTYIRCGFCDKVFMVEKDKDFHEMTEHAEQYSIKKLKTFKCDSCSETFFGQFALKQHSKTHHENK